MVFSVFIKVYAKYLIQLFIIEFSVDYDIVSIVASLIELSLYVSTNVLAYLVLIVQSIFSFVSGATVL